MPTGLEVINRALLRQKRQERQERQQQQQLIHEREQARHDRETALHRNFVTAVVTLEQMINDSSLNIPAEASAVIEKLIKKIRFIYNKGHPVRGGVSRIIDLISILNWVTNLVRGEHSEPAICQIVSREISYPSVNRKISAPVFLVFLLFEYLYVIDYINQLRLSEGKAFFAPIAAITCIINLSLLLVVVEGNAYTLGDELKDIGKLFNIPEEIQDDEPDGNFSMVHS